MYEIEKPRYSEYDLIVQANFESIKAIEAKRNKDSPIPPKYYDAYNRTPDKDHPYFSFIIPEIEKHLKSISANKAAKFLLLCEVEFKEWITKRPESGVWFNHNYKLLCSEQLRLLNTGNICEYVDLNLSAGRVVHFMTWLSGRIHYYSQLADIDKSHPEPEPARKTEKQKSDYTHNWDDIKELRFDIIKGLAVTWKNGKIETFQKSDFGKGDSYDNFINCIMGEGHLVKGMQKTRLNKKIQELLKLSTKCRFFDGEKIQKVELDKRIKDANRNTAYDEMMEDFR